MTQNGRRLLADKNNCKVKMFSVEMTFVSSLELANEPTSVAVINDKEAVVAMEDNVVLFIDITDKLLLFGQTLCLHYAVSGVAPCEDKLCTTSSDRHSHKVRLVDRQGNVLWDKISDDNGQALFKSLRFLTSHTDGGVMKIILTDRIENSITVLDRKTVEVVARREMKDKGQDGITADHLGNIYVCFWYTREVAVLPANLSEFHIILTHQEGLAELPDAIAFDHGSRQLVISNSNPGTQNNVQCCMIYYTGNDSLQ